MPLHTLAVVLLQSTQMSTMFLLPILVRKRFEAGEWQTLVVTAAPTVFFVLSIFWGDWFSRRPFARYMLVFWCVACLPFATIGLAQNYWHVLVPYLIACVGSSGYHPAAGDLLRALYGERRRGRIYSLLWGVSMLLSAPLSWGLGEWMTLDPDAFRVIFPLAAVLQLAGVLAFVSLSRLTGHDTRRQLVPHDAERRRLARLTDPIRHMGGILRADPVFARYEAAYMTYGVGWMIAAALLPLLVTDKLGLEYDQIARSTQTAYLLALVAMLYPAGLLMDKLGAVRSTALSFMMLTLYPLGLIAAGNEQGVLIANLAYGAAHAGASVGWMLGPVSLAPTPDKAQTYVAIHATLVGVRGTIFQALGVGLYIAFGRFDVPLALAAAAYAWSAWQMFALSRRMRSTPPA